MANITTYNKNVVSTKLYDKPKEAFSINVKPLSKRFALVSTIAIPTPLLLLLYNQSIYFFFFIIKPNSKAYKYMVFGVVNSVLFS